MDHGEWIVRLSIWLALVCYPAGPLTTLLRPTGERRQRVARWVWTIGCAAFLVHVASAFDVFYGWSHRVAIEETGRKLDEMIGSDVGEGLYLSYLFTVLWALDVIWWWVRGLDAYRNRSVLLGGVLHAFLFFVVFNGSVTFESGPVRWLGSAIALILATTLFGGLVRRDGVAR